MFSQEMYNKYLGRKNAIQIKFFSLEKGSEFDEWRKNYANDFDAWFQIALETGAIDSMSDEEAQEQFKQYEREHGKNIH